MRAPAAFATYAQSIPCWLTLLALLLRATPVPAQPRQSTSLNGEWLFQCDQATEWKTVQVPSSFQAHEGTEFHGMGWYRKTLPELSLPAGKRALLHFQAAATEAQVWLDGKLLGHHLGGWTPFRFDITELLRDSAAAQRHELRVRLDEKVGHNTQGFLPIIAPHFGGLWQGVNLLIVPDRYVNELELLAIGEPATETLRVEIPLAGSLPQSVSSVALRCRLRGDERWTELTPLVQRTANTLLLRAPLPNARLWSPAQPNLYELEIGLPGADGDVVRTRAAFRSLETFGSEFRLNGQPLSVRGLLNWGYSPPLVAPNPGEAVWRSELEMARARGFNLMKFCLWVPPPRYLELADELGMLAWMEYPTWHPDFSEKFLEPLRTEFREFFYYDRNHASIILRSLTCETGPSADLAVMQSLYNEAHRLIPGALVEDDSSWIGWNRVHDFYDDHPYGNNHTWVKTLAGFNEHILAHGLKPLVLGESISADTWLDRESLLARLGGERPWWTPGVLDDSARWLERMRTVAGEGGLAQLGPDSLQYGMLMRKYQVEAFRREIPYGGYVMSVIRDIPNASMGLLDYLGQPKWPEAAWDWHGDTMLLLKTESDRRSFGSGERLQGELLLSHFGAKAVAGGELTVTLVNSGGSSEPLQTQEVKDIQQEPGTLARLAELNWPMPEGIYPTRVLVRAELKTAQGEFKNEWPLWVVPRMPLDSLVGVQVHSSLGGALRKELFPGCPLLSESQTDPGSTNPVARGQKNIVVASHFDGELARYLESGGRVLFLPDGQRGSLPLSAHWFLRGAPYIPEHALSQLIPHDLFLELQHFDLAADVVPNVPFLESLDPVLLLWDSHDQKSIKTHGIIFETGAAKGRLLVSAAHHDGRTNAAGRWLLAELLEHLRSDKAPRRALPDTVWTYLKAKLEADQTNLVSRAWKFKPDPKAEGVAQGWHQPQLAAEAEWKDIRIGDWWERQGYPALDGWAWYRLWVDIPPSWQKRDVFLSFEGVDDCYELFVNGELAGKGGDPATRQDALNEKKSHNITRLVKPGAQALIAVRVYDWYGYGGIFRPVTLGTLAFRPELDWLK